jgi:3-methylcrotonyl-CoA carboxylase alpha subunit
MRAALAQTRVAGLETNAAFLHALAAEPDFIKGEVSTKFIEEHEAALFAETLAGPKQWAAAALWKRMQTATHNGDPWDTLTGFRLNRPRHAVMWIEHDGHAALLRLSKSRDGFNATLEPDASAAARRESREPVAPIKFSFSGVIKDGAMRLSIDGESFTAFAAPHGENLRIWISADHWDIAFPDPLAGISAHHSSEGSLTAPMPGVITLLSAKPGEAIEAGKPLLVMEAMKMEHAIKAPYDGVVKAYKFKPGDQVKDGDLLVEFEESA